MNHTSQNQLTLSFAQYGAPYNLRCPKLFADILNHKPPSENHKSCQFGAFFDMFLFVTNNYLKSYQITRIVSNLSDFTTVGDRQWSGEYADLITQGADIGPPYFAVGYDRSLVVDYIDVPLIYAKPMLFENPGLHRTPNVLGMVTYPVILVLLVTHFVCAVGISLSKKIESTTGPSEGMVPLLFDTMYSISFLQKDRRRWKTWTKRFTIAAWSWAVSLLLTTQLKSSFVRSLATIHQHKLRDWNDVSRVVSENAYTLLVLRNSYEAQLIATNIGHQFSKLRATLSQYPENYFDNLNGLMDHMATHPATLTIGPDLFRNSIRKKVKHVRMHEFSDISGAFMMSAIIRKNMSSLVRSAFTKAHITMVQNGIIDKILNSYDLAMHRQMNALRSSFQFVMIGPSHIIIPASGTLLVIITFLAERQHQSCQR